MTTYNGWTNYETWRINLEIFDGGDWQDYGAETCREFVEQYIEQTTEDGFARGLAMDFVSRVDWDEIAAHYQEEEAA